MNFNSLKQNSNNLSRLTQAIQQFNQQPQSQGDDRFWYPEVDKSGNGYAVIRFLPAPGEEDLPFIRLFEHSFKGPSGSWYIENSLTTLGKPDPVSEYNTKLWNSGIEQDKDQARKQKRQLRFISNIYVVQDQQNPENEGKVFLFKFGKKIFDKLNEAMNPQFQDEEPLNPFDFWKGANFKLKIRNVDSYRNYDKSEFGDRGPLFKDDSKLEQIWKQEHSLKEFLAPDKFKSYEELQEKLQKVLGAGGAPKEQKAKLPEQKAPKLKEASQKETPPWDGGDDDDMKLFEELASN